MQEFSLFVSWVNLLMGHVCFLLLCTGQMSYQFLVTSDICPIGTPVDVHPWLIKHTVMTEHTFYCVFAEHLLIAVSFELCMFHCFLLVIYFSLTEVCSIHYWLYVMRWISTVRTLLRQTSSQAVKTVIAWTETPLPHLRWNYLVYHRARRTARFYSVCALHSNFLQMLVLYAITP